MATATERIPVLVTTAEKKEIAKMAKDAGLSMGEYMRRVAAAFHASEDERVLEGMIDQMVRTTEQANQAIDKALTFVEASNRRIADLEAKRKAMR
jgi:ribosomal protein L13